MKIHTGQSSRFFGSQIQQVEAGFRALGHELTDHVSEADCIFQNNAPYTSILADRAAGRLKPGAKVILNVLDIPTPLLPDRFDLAALDRELAQADAVTCISRFVQVQLQTYLGRGSTVIFNPIKPVRRDPAACRSPFYRFAHIGRRSDPGKRFHLGAQALQLLGYSERDLCLVGNEPGWGDYHGVLRDEHLNVVYNSVDFVLVCSSFEGLGLPILEAMAGGAVPVVCNDLTTRTELLPPDLFPEYEAISPTPESIARFLATYLNDESGARLADLKERLHAHYLAVWRDRTSPVGVAQRILDVYATL